jgi:hypothetical protein
MPKKASSLTTKPPPALCCQCPEPAIVSRLGRLIDLSAGLSCPEEDDNADCEAHETKPDGPQNKGKTGMLAWGAVSSVIDDPHVSLTLPLH